MSLAQVLLEMVCMISSTESNCGIKKLDIGEPWLSIADGKALVETLKSNFTLTDLHFKIFWGKEDGERISKAVHVILKLNRHGRRLVDEQTKSAEVDLLASVVDDQDCLYFRLVESSTLLFGDRLAVAEKHVTAAAAGATDATAKTSPRAPG